MLFFKKYFNKIPKYINNLEEYIDYSKILNREIYINNNLSWKDFEKINYLIRYWNKEDINAKTIGSRKPIKIYINSLGENIDIVLSLIDIIKFSKTPIYTFNIGTVQRESFLIYLSGHKRFCYPNATFMYINNYEKIKEENDIENQKNIFYDKNILLIKKEENIKNYIIEKTEISETQYEKYNKSEWWFTAEDAFKLHICNEINKSHFLL